MKNYLVLLGIALLFPQISNAQVGINTKEPNSTLDVKGSMAFNYLSSNDINNIDQPYFLGYENHYFVYEGDKDGEIGLKNDVNSQGRLFRIKNASNFTLRIYPQNSSHTFKLNNIPNIKEFKIEPGDYVEIIRTNSSSNNAWEISYIAQSVNNDSERVFLYGAKLIIPPLNKNGVYEKWDYSAINRTEIENSTNNPYTSGSLNDKWILIKKDFTQVNNLTPGDKTYNKVFKVARASSSYSSSSGYGAENPEFFVTHIKPSYAILTYEYQGDAFDNIDKVYPLITAGNNSNWPDTFLATFEKLENVNTTSRGLKTRLTVKVSRVDFIGVKKLTWSGDEDSDWTGTFFINVLFANKF